MKLNRNVIISFVLLILIASLYRVMPSRHWGFAPQIAMALFAGSVIKNRIWAFALPLLSMLLSDVLYHFLYINNLTPISGFYDGQIINYLLFMLLTVVGFFIRERNVLSILAGSLAGPSIYFILSNFIVWIGGGGLQRPKTFDGLLMCYNDALPFYKNSLLGALFFSTILFGGYFLLRKYVWKGSGQVAKATN
jgi:hypothetical protein